MGWKSSFLVKIKIYVSIYLYKNKVLIFKKKYDDTSRHIHMKVDYNWGGES